MEESSTPIRPRFLSIWELLKSPVMLLLATSGALLFAAFYAVSVTLGRYLQRHHSFTVIEVGLAYLAIGTHEVSMATTSGLMCSQV